MRVCQKSQVVRPEGAIWAFSSHCLSFDTQRSTKCFLCLLPYIFYEGTSCHCFTYRQSCRELALVRLYLYVRQVEDSENIYGVLSVFVKALPYTHINLPDKLQFISLQLSESPK